MNLLLSLDRAFIYTFHATGLFLFPQKMSEIRVFRGHTKGDYNRGHKITKRSKILM